MSANKQFSGKPLQTFSQRLEHIARQIDNRLNGVLAENWAESLNLGHDIERRLTAAMRHAAGGGGKRLRPFLVVECAALFGVEAPSAIDAATAIECVHCYSLVHDDLPAMDNDTLRRGQPTVWKAFDEWTAILAGDGLLTLAFEILSRPQTHPDALVRIELVSILAKASGISGMVGGQALDLAASFKGQPQKMTAGYIAHMQALKTGALIEAACRMGAALGGASKPQSQALSCYGRVLGRAFQISDDLLDVEGDANLVGKATGKDADAGKATLVSVAGLEAARKALDDALAEAEAALSTFGDKAALLRETARFVGERQH